MFQVDEFMLMNIIVELHYLLKKHEVAVNFTKFSGNFKV